MIPELFELAINKEGDRAPVWAWNAMCAKAKVKAKPHWWEPNKRMQGESDWAESKHRKGGNEWHRNDWRTQGGNDWAGPKHTPGDEWRGSTWTEAPHTQGDNEWRGNQWGAVSWSSASSHRPHEVCQGREEDEEKRRPKDSQFWKEEHFKHEEQAKDKQAATEAREHAAEAQEYYEDHTERSRWRGLAEARWAKEVQEGRVARFAKEMEEAEKARQAKAEEAREQEADKESWANEAEEARKEANDKARQAKEQEEKTTGKPVPKAPPAELVAAKAEAKSPPTAPKQASQKGEEVGDKKEKALESVAGKASASVPKGPVNTKASWLKSNAEASGCNPILLEALIHYAEGAGRQDYQNLFGKVQSVQVADATFFRVGLIGAERPRWEEGKEVGNGTGFHATTESGFKSILRDMKLKEQPSQDGYVPFGGVYFLGYLDTGSEYDREYVMGKCKKVLDGAKNMAGWIFEVKFRGVQHTSTTGGYEWEAQTVRKGHFTHFKGGHARMCAHEDDVVLTAVWTSSSPKHLVAAKRVVCSVDSWEESLH